MSRIDRESPVCSRDNRDNSIGPSDIRDDVFVSRNNRDISVDTRGNCDVTDVSRDTRDIPAVHISRPTPKSKSDSILAHATAVSYSNEITVASDASKINNNVSKSTENAQKRDSTVEDLPCTTKITPRSVTSKEGVQANCRFQLIKKLSSKNPLEIPPDPETNTDDASSPQRAASKGSRIGRSSSECTILKGAHTWSSISLPPDTSSSSMGMGLCRICMTCGRERLISPCYCKGSLGLMHVSCLERWLSIAGRSSCELCGFHFPVLQTQRYSLCRALNMWFSYSRNRATFQTDCLFFWMLSILTTALVVCCALGSRYFMQQGGMVGVPRAMAEGLIDVLMAIVLCGYAVTTYALWRDHASVWRRWRNATMDVRLVLQDMRPQTNPAGR